jgi:hypothetical protein
VGEEAFVLKGKKPRCLTGTVKDKPCWKEKPGGVKNNEPYDCFATRIKIK